MLVTFYLLLLLFFSCVDLDNNPISSDYTGDYELSVDFNLLPDTLTIFKSYSLSWEETGNDPFYRITVTTNPVRQIVQSDQSRHSPFPLYFTTPFTGLLQVAGVRPNNRVVIYGDSVTVINPYSIVVDSASLLSHANIVFSLVNIQTGETAPAHLKCRRQVDESIITRPANSSFSITVARPDTVTVHASVCDSMDHCVECESLTVYAPYKILPAVNVVERNLLVPVASPYTLIASMTNADSLHWHIQRSGKDTVTTMESLTYVWTDVLHDTVIVTAKNRFGVIGTNDTIFLDVQKRDYELEIVTFPARAEAKKVASWEVIAKHEGKVISDDEVTYHWSVRPISAIDSISVKNGKLIVIPSDNADSFMVNVGMIIEGDTLVQRSVIAHVIIDKPILQVHSDPDTTGINDTVYFSIKARDTNTGGSIDAVYARKDRYDTLLALTSDRIALTFSNPGKHIVAFWCIDNDGLPSDTVYRQVLVVSNHPWFINQRFDTLVYINDSLRIIAPARAGNTDGTVTSWVWDTDADGMWDTTTSDNYIDTIFHSDGNENIIVGCIDERSDSAETNMQFRITVSKGAPEMKSLSIINEPRFVGDTVNLRLIAFDPHGVIDSLQFAEGFPTYSIAVESPSDSIDTIVPIVMQYAGTFRVAARVTDNDGLQSDTVCSRDSLVIQSGKPSVTTSAFPTSIWIDDTTAFSLSGSDPNGSITAWAVQWNNDDSYELRKNNGNFTHVFSDTGSYTFHAYVIDDDGFSSDTVHHEVMVHLGAPYFNSITTDIDPDALFMGDSITFSVKGTDPNGHIDSLLVWVGNDTTERPFGSKTSDDSVTFRTMFTEGDIGDIEIRIHLKDIDGFIADTVYTVTILRGSPVITSAECENDTLWVNDEHKYSVSAIDSNGVLKFLYVNWDGADDPQDSLKISGDRSSIDTFFVHRYDTTGGNKTARFFAIDDDGNTSEMRNVKVIVNKGAPSIWGDSRDTLWVVVDNDFGNYYFKPHYSDTNGSVSSFLFGLTDNITNAAESNADSALIIIDENNINKGSTRYIWVKDDDGLVRGSRFVVYADSAPPQPTLIGPETDTAYFTDVPVVLKWSGFDLHDGPSTEYAVVVNPPGTDTPEEIIQNYRPASDYDREGDIIMYTFTPKTSGIHSWHILAHDIQGSATSSATRQLSHPGE